MSLLSFIKVGFAACSLLLLSVSGDGFADSAMPISTALAPTSSSGDQSFSPASLHVSSGQAATAAISGFDQADVFPHTFAPSADDFANPERGFYSYVNILTRRNFDDVKALDHSLVYSYIRLDDYRDQPIGDGVLNDLIAGLYAAREHGLKVIPRFAYNFGPWPDSEPDASKEWVVHHIEQLRPILHDNADIIAKLQAGFIGAWGEWHSSTNGLLDDPADWQEIVQALLGAVPEHRMVQLRYPAHKGAMFEQPLHHSQAFSGHPQARIGHHNDCFLASDTDKGTYPSDQIEYWKTYLERDTRFVPMGGETCAQSHRSGCATALTEMERLNYSYLNSHYHPDVLNDWKADGCYDEIKMGMGYRLELILAELPQQVRPGGRFTAKVVLRNRGFAAPFNYRPLFLVLSNEEASHQVQLDRVDAREWQPGVEHQFVVTLQLPMDITEGSYDFSIWMPDEVNELRRQSDFSVRFANADLWNELDGYNRLTQIVVTDSAAGSQNASADAFEVWMEGDSSYHNYQALNKSIYVWNTGVRSGRNWSEDENAERLVNFSRMHGFKRAIIYVGAVEWHWENYFSQFQLPDQQEIVYLNYQLRQAGIEPVAAFYLNDDPNDLSNHLRAADVVQTIHAFNQAYPESAFFALEGDQEPNAVGEDYLAMNQAMLDRKQVLGASFPVGAALRPRWLNRDSNYGLDSELADALTTLDEGMIMAYSNQRNISRSFANRSLEHSQSAGNKPIYVAIETEDLEGTIGNEDSFYEMLAAEDKTEFFQMVVDMDEEYRAHPLYRGMVIHAYKGFFDVLFGHTPDQHPEADFTHLFDGGPTMHKRTWPSLNPDSDPPGEAIFADRFENAIGN